MTHARRRRALVAVCYAKIADVKPGTCLRADGGFTCIAEGAILTVEADENGNLFVPCHGPDAKRSHLRRISHERHYLECQHEGAVLIGFYLVKPTA